MVFVVFGGPWRSLVVLKWFWWSLGVFGGLRGSLQISNVKKLLVVFGVLWLYKLSIYYHPFLRLFQSVVGF